MSINLSEINFNYLVDCGDPPFLDFGLVELTFHNVTTAGATANQSCQEGYDLIGNDVMQCEENGTWTGLASCSIKDYAL